MAEVIATLGVIASVAQLADYGFQLSLKLYSYSSAVSSASSSIKAISNDVSLTSTVLKELCYIIKSDDAHVVSENAVLATKQTVDECLKIFRDLDEGLNRSLVGMGMGMGKGDREVEAKGKGRANRGTVALERLKWPFKQSKMELLRCNLDRLKASLTLMLQVLSYARDVSSRKEAESSLEYQKQIIESLARSERLMKRKYYALQHALEEKGSQDAFSTTINTSINIEPSRDIFDEPPDYQDPSPAAKSSNPIGELLLCFKLIRELLEPDYTIREDEGLSNTYDEVLRKALKIIEGEEISRIEMRFVDQPLDAKVEAAKSIQIRLSNLVKTQYSVRPVESRQMGRDRSEPEKVVLYSSRVFLSPEDETNEANEANDTNDTSLPILQDIKPHNEVIPLPSSISPELDTIKPQPQPPTSAALQSEIDSTVHIMQEHINKVQQRGERLDSLQDHTDNLAVSAQRFRRAALRSRMSPWMRAYQDVTEGVAYVGTKGYETVQGLSRSLYEAGSALFVGPEEEVVDEADAYATQVVNFSMDLEDENDDEDEGEGWQGDEGVVDELLSLWTTLPTQSHEALVEKTAV